MKLLKELEIGTVVLILAAIGAATPMSLYYVHKEFHNITTPVSADYHNKGYVCFVATSSTSVAISCLPDKDNK